MAAHQFTPPTANQQLHSQTNCRVTIFCCIPLQNVRPVKCTIPVQAPATPPATIPTHPVASLASKGVLVRKERCGTTENVSTKTPASLMVCHKKSHYCNPKITE